MKRAILFIVATASLLAPLAAQAIHVMQPNAGERLTLGQKPPKGFFLIRWAIKDTSQNVKIVLLRADGSKFGLIEADQKPGPAVYPWESYNWFIGQTKSGMAPAGQYKIRVAAMDNSCEDVSDFPFEIVAPPGVSKIAIPIVIDHVSRPLIVLKPDLIVCKILPVLLDKSLYLQKLQFRVHNIGKGPAPACSVWIDCPQVLGPQNVKALGPGEFEEFTYESAKIYWAGADIAYTFHVDKAGLVAESNESNNVLTGKLSIYASEPAKCSDGQRHSVFKITKK